MPRDETTTRTPTANPQTWTTSGGRRWPSEAEAMEHQKAIDIEERFEDARKARERLIIEQCRTADNVPVRLGRDYYWLTPYYFEMPRVQEVTLSWYNRVKLTESSYSEAAEREVLVDPPGSHGRKEPLKLKLSELYADRRAADEECHRQAVERLRELASDHNIKISELEGDA